MARPVTGEYPNTTSGGFLPLTKRDSAKMLGYATSPRDWHLSRPGGLTVKIYARCKRKPPGIDLGLDRQLRRAAISIPSNIAEGNERGSNRDALHFLHISRGSLRELETQIEVCLRTNLIGPTEAEEFMIEVQSAGRLLDRLIRYRKSRPN